MKEFGAVLLSTKEIFDITLSFDGFTFSFWDIALWMIVGVAVLVVALEWMSGD